MVSKPCSQTAERGSVAVKAEDRLRSTEFRVSAEATSVPAYVPTGFGGSRRVARIAIGRDGALALPVAGQAGATSPQLRAVRNFSDLPSPATFFRSSPTAFPILASASRRQLWRRNARWRLDGRQAPGQSSVGRRGRHSPRRPDAHNFKNASQNSSELPPFFVGPAADTSRHNRERGGAGNSAMPGGERQCTVNPGLLRKLSRRAIHRLSASARP